MAGFTRHALVFRSPEATRPGSGDAGDSGDTGAPLRGDGKAVVQSGDSRRPIGPIRPIGPTALCYGTSQTCRGCRGKWKFGSLDAWKFGFSAQRLFCRALAARSVFCFLFSVAVEGLALWACTLCSLGRASAPSPAGAWGSAPHPNQLISQSAGRQRRPFGLIAARGGGPGSNLRGSSKPPNLQTFPV